MSNRFVHIITLLLAGYLVIVASNPNINHYCSEECEEHHECRHHHHHTYHCGVEIGEACHCGITHIVAPESNTPVHPCIVPIVYSHTVATFAIAEEPQISAAHKSFHPNHAPPILNSGREVITRKSVLII